MSATLELFDRWKAFKKIASDRQGAAALGLSQGAAAQWRSGRNGSAAVIEKMAKDLGEDPVPVILQAFAEAARDADDRRTLAKLARRVGAACVALLALVPLMLHSSPAAAAVGHEGDQARTALYIMRTRFWVALAAFARRWRLRTAPRLQPHDMEPVTCNHPASCLASQ